MATNNITAPATIAIDPNADNGVYELESLCMNCHENGMTRILPIQIPYFKQILLESFSCEHCGERNNSVKPAGAIQEKGARYIFKIESQDDFQRQVVRGDTGTFRVEDLDLATPPSAGQLTNLESTFEKIMTDLQVDQLVRKVQSPELHDALDRIIQRLESMLKGDALPVTVSLDDPSGNSFIEPSPTDSGSKYHRQDYLRTLEQNIALGLAVEADVQVTNGDAMDGVNVVDGEIFELTENCPACTKECTVNIKKVQIPHFKEVMIMATVCDHCGYRTSDVKTGGIIPEKGQRITLKVLNKEDLSRDILKSESCALKCPELSLEVQPGTLGGRFTTVEGLLAQVRDQLYGQIFDAEADKLSGPELRGGDSMTTSIKTKWTTFFDQLNKALNAEFEFEIILEDALANSHIQALSEDDKQILIEEYERTEEEMEELGLNDMKVEGYENGEQAKESPNGLPAEE